MLDSLCGPDPSNKLMNKLQKYFRRMEPGICWADVARDAGDRILYDQATGRLFYDAGRNGAGAAVLFASVTAGLNLSAGGLTVF